jgi:hypothetical protein
MIPSFYDMSSAYSDALSKYKLQELLRNIVNAAETRPLNFLDIPTIQGSGSISPTPGISGSFGSAVFGTGGAAIGSLSNSITPSLTLGISNSFSYSQSSLDNAVFLKAMSTRLPLKEFRSLLEQDYPREVVFNLLLSRVFIIKADNSYEEFDNFPLNENGYLRFEVMMTKLLNSGLTVQLLSPALTPSQKIKTPSEADTTQYKICIDKKIYKTHFPKHNFSDDMFCGLDSSIDQSSTKGDQIVFIPRSPSAVFQYLGHILYLQNNPEKPRMITLPKISSDDNIYRFRGNLNQRSLLVVDKYKLGVQNNDSLISFKSGDGELYRIPNTNDGFSRSTLSILNNIITISKQPNAFPPNPSVIVR